MGHTPHGCLSFETWAGVTVVNLVPCRIEMKRKVELEASTVYFIEDHLVHTHFKDRHVVSEEEVQAMFDVIREHRGANKVLLMVTLGNGTSLSNEARAHASSPASCQYIAADAIVMRDFEHQLAANVFVRHHKPERPIKMFPDQDSALRWLREQEHLLA